MLVFFGCPTRFDRGSFVVCFCFLLVLVGCLVALGGFGSFSLSGNFLGDRIVRPVISLILEKVLGGLLIMLWSTFYFV